jgi:hypothetical protein
MGCVDRPWASWSYTSRRSVPSVVMPTNGSSNAALIAANSGWDITGICAK